MKRFGVIKPLITLLVLLAAGCNLPRTLTPTPPSVSSPTLENIPTPSPTPVPSSDLVWFAPNMGSNDYASLFSKTEQWKAARSKINVFKFYTQNVLDDPCPICAKNTLSNLADAHAFQVLAQDDIAIAVEVGAVKEWGCTSDITYGVAQTVIRNIQTHGGSVAFLAMDEPLFGGRIKVNNTTCGYEMEQSAAVTAEFMAKVKAAYPQMGVGDIEPYPEFSVPELERWLLTLQDRDAGPAFFHLDVDMERVRVEKQDVKKDLRSLSQFCTVRGIPFGVIFTSTWRAAGSERSYYDSTMTWIRTVNEAIGAPQQMIFQSWQGPAKDGFNEVPLNLPEDDLDIYSHTRLLIDGLAVFGR